MSTATFLVIHGSRDPRPGLELTELLRQLRSSCPAALIEGGMLEATEISLAEQIQQFSDQAQICGYPAINVFPLFLLPGIHVCEDVPAAVKTAQARSPLPITLLPYLGQQPGLMPLLQSILKANQAWVFLGHGSRRPEAMAWIDHLAGELGAIPAYWTKPESLKAAIEQWVSQEITEMRIFPYLLFAGKLLELITQQVQDLNQDYPQLKLHLTDCLRPGPELVNLVQDGLGFSETLVLSSN
ncbi:CbiX/SirB N-terminal domain-containing protein [Thermosynechococcaceae cyanobacterium BACA0444]|uniref:CbiX/SirB N-terminal domain-containing protein n=1 Tax=Pseudocalidococcus azoricus BACA0444 TaxID=2918990 RepID=A0AAE4FSK9_9CYAN|nr:CbiX/SirB N-terminal domain-containing protein [Pseudocalidococcus azoricus]MDS3861410.1 CbiX/SirB N-terminal domain-containing protein [Pseudocalidococcus azoricus BACA0444]